MPDTRFTKLTMAEENFPAMRPKTGENLSSRRWMCPDDQTIAEYVDGVLGHNRKARIEFHLAKCDRCRLIVSDVVKLQREVELPVTPFELKRRTVQFVPAVSARPHWIWAPAAAVALILLITVILSVRREPRKLLVTSPPLPSVPMISKAELPMVHDAPRREVLRRPEVSEMLPVILSPQRDGAVVLENLKFNWKPVSRSRNYKVSVVTSDGDLLWEGQTEKSTLHLPSDVVLKRGAYFVWITAYLADGRVAKSSPVRFVIKG